MRKLLLRKFHTDLPIRAKASCVKKFTANHENKKYAQKIWTRNLYWR